MTFKPSAAGTATMSRDAWSVPYAIALPILISAALMSARAGLPLVLLLIFPLILLAALFYGARFIYDTFTGKMRHAVSVLMGLLINVVIIWAAPRVFNAFDDLSFYIHKHSYQDMVEKERAGQAHVHPIRMVVEFQDRSLFVTANDFFYIIYDETDEAITNPDSVTGEWPFPGSGAGGIKVDGMKTIYHIIDHFYRFHTDGT